jgi:hypothetical protein
MARKVTRVLEIRPRITFDLDNQFTTMEGIRLDPDTVVVTGPDVILDTMRFATTRIVSLGLLTRDYRDKVNLERVDDLVYSYSKVDCYIELEKFTEVQLSVPVEVVNLPDSLTLQTFPSKVRLTCTVGLSKYDRMENHQFRAVVDYAGIKENRRVLDVSIRNVPVYLLSYDYNPRSVEYIISRK